MTGKIGYKIFWMAELVVLLFAIIASPPLTASEKKTSEMAMNTRTITGLLTNQGVECPAMTGDDGQLYTLLGDLQGFKAGQRVTIETLRLERISKCQQGHTIRIHSIKATHTTK